MARPIPPTAPEPEESAWRSAPEVSDGGSFTPSDGVVARGGTPRTEIEARPVFQLVHDPKRWTVMDGHVIPLFDKMVFVTGVNGVDANRRTGGPQVGAARSEREVRGQIMVPFDAIPKAHQGQAKYHQIPGAPPSYLWQPKGRPDCTLLIYEQAHPGDPTPTTDRKGYIEFCENLVRTGVIPAVPLYTLRRMLTTHNAQLSTLIDRAKTVPSAIPLAEAKQAMIDAIKAAIIAREKAEAARGGATVSDGGAFHPDAG